LIGVIRSADALAEKLAELARGVRDAARTMIRRESEHGQLRRWYRAFQTELIHDLTEEDFADAYAQTITYGLLTAAILRAATSEGSNGPAPIADDLSDIAPGANPFLKETLQSFIQPGGRKGRIDFDELGIQDVVDLMRGEATDLHAVLRDFGARTRGEDPIIHFYARFLAAYNKRLKVHRGVFYTPQPVVSYIVRSAHKLLQNEFGLEDGLADTTTWAEFVARERRRNPQSTVRLPEGVAPDSPFVQILDPGAGTGTFLVEVIDVIYQTLRDKWTKQGLNETERRVAWNEYAPKRLLPRLHGYELMMAPYAIAHLKLSLKLKETGFTAWDKLDDNDRSRIYLTNALDPASDETKRMGFNSWAPAIAHEAAAVDEIKRRKRFTVVIGNPPYAGLSANLTEHARELVGRYKFINGAKINERGTLQLEKNLQDDYIKFLAFAEDRLNDAGAGVCGMICNHGFIDNPTLRAVRWSLLRNFRQVWILDLHGNVNRGEKSPDGSADQNVFDIKDAGVAIYLGLKGRRDVATDNQIRKTDVWGDRESSKYPFLRSNDYSSHSWDTVTSEPEFFLFRALSQEGSDEYNAWPKVTEIFPLHSIGMITARDAYVMDFTTEPIIERARAFRDSKLGAEATCKALGIPIKKGWNVSQAQERIRSVKDLSAYVRPVLYRPFDTRPVFYHESLIWGMAWPVMRHMVKGGNLSLITSRMTKGESFHHVLVSNTLSEVILLSSKTSNNAFAFPLHLRPDNSKPQVGSRTNLAPQFLASLANGLGLSKDKVTGLPTGVEPNDIFHYIYAALHSPGYRSRYAEFLKIDFPRLPLTPRQELFRALGRLGAELVAVHLVEFALKGEAGAPAEWPRYSGLARFTGPDRTVGKFPSADKAWKDGFVAINASSGFKGIPEEVWKFQIGGYQVCHKWLSDRRERKNLKGRALNDEDILHYCKIVTALNETIRLMRQIDEAIDLRGGWPGAFRFP